MQCKAVDWLVMLAIQQVGVYNYDTYDDVADVLGLEDSEEDFEEEPRTRYVARLIKVGRLPPVVREEFRKLMFGEATFVTWSMMYVLYHVYNGEYTQWPDGDGPLFTKLWNDYQPGTIEEGRLD